MIVFFLLFKDPSASVERDIFGAHYDEGRITRSSDTDFVWSSLAKESIARYREIEHSSGIVLSAFSFI